MDRLVENYKEKYQLKEFDIKVEKCDKIWETLQLIRNVQNISTKKGVDKVCLNQSKNQITYSSIPDNPKYRVVVNKNGRFFHCNECGRNFKNFSPLRHHAFKIHTSYIPPMRNRIVKGAFEIKALKSQTKRTPLLRNSNLTNKVSNLKKQILGETNVSPVPQPATPIPEKASLVSQKPGPLSQKPGPLSQKLEPVSQKPEPVSQKPGPLSQKLEPVSQKPEPVSQKPGPLSQKSAPIISQPTKVKSEVQTASSEIRCILCKKFCKNIRKHIITYHKILYPDLIVDQCMQNSEVKTAPEVKPEETVIKPAETLVAPAEPLAPKPKSQPAKKQSSLGTSRSFPTISFKSSFPSRQKLARKTRDWQPEVAPRLDNKFACHECDSVFESKRSLANHRRIHERGLRKTKKAKKPIKRPFEDDEDEDITLKRLRSLYGNNNDESVCDCGRSFRNPHTLYLHKVKCKMSDEETSCATRNSSDRDSGIGISITIKKKNNSYEIVNKDKSSSNNTETSSVNSCDVISLSDEESGKEGTTMARYSKSHSVLKLQKVEDDEDVDIEDDGLSVASRNIEDRQDINAAGETRNKNISPAEEMLSSLEETDPLAMEPAPETKEESPAETLLSTLHELSCKKPKTLAAVLPNRPRELYFPMLKPRRRRLEQQCICGKKFRSSYFLNLHVKKLHPRLLNCNYCGTTFDKFEDYDNHDCKVVTPKFEPDSFKMACPLCNDQLELSYEKFDRHVMSYHFDPNKAFLCFVCSERFDNTNSRRVHFQTHALPPCEICNKHLYYDLQIKHNLYHRGVGYPCHRCKRAYAQKSIVVKHITKTHKRKSNQLVSCEICFKQMQESSLRKHRYMHRVEFTCKVCGEVRLGMSRLVEHVDKKHRKDYPYVKCCSCEMSFVMDKLLEKHLEDGVCVRYNIEQKMGLQLKGPEVVKVREKKVSFLIDGDQLELSEKQPQLVEDSSKSDEEELVLQLEEEEEPKLEEEKQVTLNGLEEEMTVIEQKLEIEIDEEPEVIVDKNNAEPMQITVNSEIVIENGEQKKKNKVVFNHVQEEELEIVFTKCPEASQVVTSNSKLEFVKKRETVKNKEQDISIVC